MRQHRSSLVVLVLLAVMSAACGQANTSLSMSTVADSITIEPMAIRVPAACFRSPHSVLFGPPTPSGQQGKSPGWLGIEVSEQRDSGWAKLIDPGSKAFDALWRRSAGDSVTFVAADDFLRVEMRLAVSDSVVVGSARAHSDAALEPDASGRLSDLRREWSFRAVRAPCDSMPTG